MIAKSLEAPGEILLTDDVNQKRRVSILELQSLQEWAIYTIRSADHSLFNFNATDNRHDQVRQHRL